MTQLTTQEKAIISNDQSLTSDTTHLATDLRTRVVRGGFWVFAIRISTRLFGLVRTIILARLLAPADFGLFGIALLAISALQTFSQTGFDAALVQKKQDITLYLDTAWTIQVIRAMVLGLIAFTIAPYVATFFDAPPAKPILQVIAFSVLLGGFGNIGLIYFQKELEFHKTFVYTLSGILADIGVAIPAAFLLRSVWALVFGLLAGNVVRIVLSYFIHPYRPRLAFNKQQFKELFGFGKWILGSSILTFLLGEGDDIFVGKLLGLTALGFYQLAYRMSNMPATEYSHLIAKATFPAYSKLQDNLPKLREAYLRVLQLTAFLAIPIGGGIFILAPEFTRIFLGEKWMPMVPAMQILALYGTLRAIGATTGVVFLAVGKPEIGTKIKAAQLALLAVLIYPLTAHWGIAGAAIAVTAYMVVFNVVAVFKVLNIVKSDFKKPAKMFMIPLIATLLMIFVILATRTYIFVSIGLAPFFLLIALGIFVYLLIAHLFDRFLDYGTKALIREQLVSLLQKPNRQ